MATPAGGGADAQALTGSSPKPYSVAACNLASYIKGTKGCEVADIISDQMKEVLADYVAVKQLEDGRWVGLQRLMYHYTIHVGIDEIGYQDRWCIASLAMAVSALENFDGTEPPLYWHKHPATGRYRDLASGIEWTASDKTPAEVDGSGWPYNYEPEPEQVAAPAMR